MENHDGEDQRPTFWKKSTKPVPGRPRAWEEIRSNSQPNSSSSTSFQYFQERCCDAWETRDEERSKMLDTEVRQRTVHSAVLSRGGEALSPLSPTESDPNGQPQNAKSYTATTSKCEDYAMVHKSPTCKNNTHRSHTKLKAAVGADGEISMGRVAKFQLLLESNLLDLEDLRRISWSGVPVEVRPVVWRLLAGYLPASLERRQAIVERKRLEYWNILKQYFNKDCDVAFQATYRQIHIDVPRMSSPIALFKQKTVREMFERILFTWAIRHPASGYVQGINDLVTPFYIVFLQEFLPAGRDLYTFRVSSLPKKHQDIIEADSFWCLSKFLDGIQDNYIFAQLGIQHKVNQLKELTRRMDGTLHMYLQSLDIDYLQFSFRWMNNLLTREIPLHCSIRLWDTYLAEYNGFASFHLYVCAAFLLHWRRELLLKRDFQGVLLMLQNLPTHNWTEADVGVLVAEAYQLKFTFDDAQNQLQSSDNR